MKLKNGMTSIKKRRWVYKELYRTYKKKKHIYMTVENREKEEKIIEEVIAKLDIENEER